MPDLQGSKMLREQRAEIAAQMAALNKGAFEEDRALNPEEREKFDRMNADLDTLDQRVQDMERVEEIQRDLDKPITEGGLYHLERGQYSDRRPADRDKMITERDQEWALRAWGLQDMAPQPFRDAAEKCGVNPFATEQVFQLMDTRQYEEARRRFRDEGITYRATTFQSVGTDAAGGYTVPTRLSSTLEDALLYFGGMRQAATILRTADGADLNIPTGDDTALATVLTENTAATIDDLAFSQLTLRAHMYSSGMVRSSIQLLQDTAIDLVGYIGSKLGERLARGTNADFTTGSTATTSPRGILRDSVAGYTASTATGGNMSLTAIMEVFHSVDREYRALPGTAWMMHDGFVKEARLVVDSNGQPLWGAGLRAGEPDTLVGEPVIVNNRMTASSTVTGSPTIALFGALNKYLIRDVLDVRIARFNERYFDALQIGWLGYMRSDGRLLIASTVAAKKPVKHMVSATT